MKNILKKKGSANTKFIIASAGKNKETASAKLLHLNSADSNDSDAIKEHYKKLIDKGLDPQKVKLVVTDMLIAYISVIKVMFPLDFCEKYPMLWLIMC